MRIIINSDILYSGRLDKLPSGLQRLGEECARTDNVIVLPRTTLLEIERHQRKIVEDLIIEIERSYELLRRMEINFEERNPTELFTVPDLVQLFRDCGATVEVEEPTLEDFNDAHKRACLHLPPGSPDTKSDEMRDLVIWAIALRIAIRDNGAILLSRDHLHMDERGHEEASATRLQRVKSIDEILEVLGVESPRGRLARSLLEPIWNDLRTAGLPLTPTVALRKVDNSIFTRGETIIEHAAFDFKANAENGGVLGAHIEITSKEQKIAEAMLRDITVDGRAWREGTIRVSPDKPAPQYSPQTKEGLDALREAIGGQ